MASGISFRPFYFEQTTENPLIEHTEAVHPEHVITEDDIELNNGDEWEVNRQTTEGVERMSQVLPKQYSELCRRIT